MEPGANPEYLRQQQYRTAANLEARIRLHAEYSTSGTSFQRWIFDRLELLETARILDVGCGTGLLWAMNAERLRPGWHLTLSDLSEGMLEEARRRLTGLPATLEFVAADVQQLPLANQDYDAVIANSMLYHVPDRATALRQIHRVLRPGGKLYAATNGSAHLRELRELETRFGLETVFGQQISARNFGLKNGAAQLEPWFENIKLDLHDDSLLVPEPEPIVAHIRSRLRHPERASDRLERLRRHLEAEIREHGPYKITKSSGLFTASRREVG